MINMNVKLAEGSPLPAYAKEGDAGFDLYLHIQEPLEVGPDACVKVGLGIAVAIPTGHFGLVVPRSSLSKRNLMLANTVGIIDSGYRGEVMAVVRNIGQQTEVLQPSERLFQMVIVPFAQVAFRPVDTLDDTARGAGGFGSSGL